MIAKMLAVLLIPFLIMACTETKPLQPVELEMIVQIATKHSIKLSQDGRDHLIQAVDAAMAMLEGNDHPVAILDSLPSQVDERYRDAIVLAVTLAHSRIDWSRIPGQERTEYVDAILRGVKRGLQHEN